MMLQVAHVMDKPTQTMNDIEILSSVPCHAIDVMP